VKESQRLTKELTAVAKEKQAKKDILDAWRVEGINFSEIVPGPILEDEFFGGFRPSIVDDPPENESLLKARPERARVLNTLPVEQRGFSRYRQRSSGWAGEMPTGYPPFVHKGLWEKNHPERPTPAPERDNAERAERRRAAQERFGGPMNPNKGPSKTFAYGIRPLEESGAAAEDMARLSRNRVKWTHNLRCGHRPSRALEAKRFPKLKRVSLNPLVTNEYLRRGGGRKKEQLRAEAQYWFARCAIDVFPPEKFAAELRPGPKMGRPTIYDRPLSDAERKAGSRAIKIQMRPSPAGAVRPGAARRLHPLPAAPGFFIPTRGGLIRILSGPSRITPIEGGAYMVTPVPTPRDATSSLIGAIAIPTMTEVLAELICLEAERARRARAREAKASVLAWRAKRAAEAEASKTA